MKKLCLIWPLPLILCFISGCQNKEAMADLDAMKTQARIEAQNKGIVLRWFGEVNRNNFEELYDELFAADSKQFLASSSEPLGFEEYKPIAKRIYEAFPEITHTVNAIIAEGDKVAAKILVQTVHEGEFAGIPATGKNLEWTSIAIFQISDGKIKTRWEVADILGLYQQLGMELKPKETEK